MTWLKPCGTHYRITEPVRWSGWGVRRAAATAHTGSCDVLAGDAAGGEVVFRWLGLSPVDGGVDATDILDWRHPLVGALIVELGSREPRDEIGLLRDAHRLIGQRVRPGCTSLQDAQSVSRTLRRGRGSCSQRLAVLEAVARAWGVSTRVRGLVVDGRFWYPRFPRMRFLVPDQVVLAWPEFLLDSEWVQVAELFGSLSSLSEDPGGGFTNAGAETLFDALARTAVDFDGRDQPAGHLLDL